MASRSGKEISRAVRYVKPILSFSKNEARARVLNLYKAWYRQIPYMVKVYYIPLTVQQGRKMLRSKFEKNRDVTDIRIIDRLVINGQMELVEVINGWAQKTHILNHFKYTEEPRPTSFLGKFYDGHYD